MKGEISQEARENFARTFAGIMEARHPGTRWIIDLDPPDDSPDGGEQEGGEGGPTR